MKIGENMVPTCGKEIKVESWRNEFYGSDYGSQYLSHGRRKISEGGARNGETNFPWRYKPTGHLPGYLKEKSSSSFTKTSTTANRPVSRERDVDPNTTATVGRRGEPLPLGTTAGEFTIGKDGLYESYAKNRPTTPPEGKTAEEPEPNGLTTEQAAKLKEQSEQKSAAEKKPAPSPLKKPVKEALLEERDRDLKERADQERLKKLAAQRAIDAIKNEKIGSVLKDYAGIVGDMMKLMAKGTLAGYASMLPGKNDAARVIGESVQKDAQKLGYRIGTRIAKNKIRRGK